MSFKTNIAHIKNRKKFKKTDIKHFMYYKIEKYRRDLKFQHLKREIKNEYF